MSIEKFNQAVENYKSHSVVQNLQEMRGAVNFYSAPKLRRDLDRGRNHMTVHTITRYFQSKIYISVSQFRHIKQPNILTYQFSQENKPFCLHLYHNVLIFLQAFKLYMNLSGIFHGGYLGSWIFKLSVILRFILIGQRLQNMLTLIS